MKSLQKYLLKPVDNAPLIWFRVAFGAIMLWEVIRYFSLGRIAKYYIKPQYIFYYFNLDFIKPLPGNAMYAVFFLLGICALLVCIGLFYRIASIGLFLLFTYIFLLDQTRYLNHFYLLSLISFLMIFIPANRDFSLDVLRKPEIQSNQVLALQRYILMFQVSCTYFFGGVAKLNSDWLHGEPVRMWLSTQTGFPLVGKYFTQEWAVYFFTYGGLFFDLLIVPLLLWRKTRWPAFIAAFFFNMMNDSLFRIGVFPWFMLVSTLILFFELPAVWRRWKQFKATDKKLTLPSRPKLVLSLIAIYCGIQILLPLRHWFYPGNVSWTEEGHQFAWHMKLRNKIAYSRFFIEDKFSGQRKEISPKYFLTDHQIGVMSACPELILQFSHFLKEELGRQHIRDVRVKCIAICSLNGRDTQLLVDSTVDLSAQKYSWKHFDWITPLHETLPHPKDLEKIKPSKSLQQKD